MNLEFIESKIGYTFKNKSILQTALVHKSYLKERPKDSEINSDNERLEFLGDAVLELISTEYLYKTFEEDEGVLTAVRSVLVNATYLSKIGISLGLDDNIYLSRGEKGESGKAKEMIVADAMEAVIGAMYLDGGYNAAQKFIINNILPIATEVIANSSFKDPKTTLQELLQEKHKITPQYVLTSTEGKDHEKRFFVAVLQGELELAKGEGLSKQKAETDAAIKALEYLQNHPEPKLSIESDIIE
jgi:ribonuclease III